MWVDRGDLVQGGKRTHVGTKASDLQKLIDALPPAKPLANVRSPTSFSTQEGQVVQLSPVISRSRSVVA